MCTTAFEPSLRGFPARIFASLAVLKVNAREDVAVEAEGMTLVNDEVVEVGLQPVRGPALFDGPSALAVRDRKPARAQSAHHAHRVDQNAAIRRESRLDDRTAFPRVLPQP